MRDYGPVQNRIFWYYNWNRAGYCSVSGLDESAGVHEDAWVLWLVERECISDGFEWECYF